MHAIWITGLGRSGKTTLARGIAEYLRSDHQRVEILDETEIRRSLGGSFGYSREERSRVSRILCTMAKLLTKNDVIAIVPATTALQECRDFNRSELPSYLEIQLDCPLDVCMERDQTQGYRRALQGDLDHFVGVDTVYEISRDFDLCIDTALQSEAESLSQAIGFLDEALVYA